MSTYTPSDVALTTITLPADGENIDAVDVNAPLQNVADGIVHVAASVTAEAAARAAADTAISTHKRLIDVQMASVQTITAGVASPFTTTSATFVDATGFTLAFTSECNVGDIIIVRTKAGLYVSSGAAACQVVVTDGGVGDVALADTLFESAITAQPAAPFNVTSRYVLTQAGTGFTANVKIQVKAFAGITAKLGPIGTNANIVTGYSTIVAELWRP